MLAVIGGVVAVLLLLLVAVLWTVDDWSRDFTTNSARWDQPLATRLSEKEASAAVIKAAQSLPRWEFVQESQTPEAALELHFTRTTALFRFVDDIRVTIAPSPGGPGSEQTQINAASQSRIGKGDLGQNPRNLRELKRAIQEGLPSSE